MTHRERGCLKRTHGGPGGGKEKIAFAEREEEGRERRERGRNRGRESYPCM